MRKVPRIMIDRLIRYAKRWWGSGGNMDDLHAVTMQADEITAYTKVNWQAWSHFASAICQRNGLNEDIDLQAVYKCLAALGWEVVD